MSLVERIQSLCSNKNTTLIGLEREIGLGRGTIRNWDKNSPSIDKVQKVADYFNVSVDYLLGNVDNPQMRLVDRRNLPEEIIKLFGDIQIVSNRNISDKYISEKLLSELEGITLYNWLIQIAAQQKKGPFVLLNELIEQSPKSFPLGHFSQNKMFKVLKEVNLKQLIENPNNKEFSFLNKLILNTEETGKILKKIINPNDFKIYYRYYPTDTALDEDIQIIARGIQKMKIENPEDFDAFKRVFKSMSNKADEELDK